MSGSGAVCRAPLQRCVGPQRCAVSHFGAALRSAVKGFPTMHVCLLATQSNFHFKLKNFTGILRLETWWGLWAPALCVGPRRCMSRCLEPQRCVSGPGAVVLCRTPALCVRPRSCVSGPGAMCQALSVRPGAECRALALSVGPWRCVSAPGAALRPA